MGGWVERYVVCGKYELSNLKAWHCSWLSSTGDCGIDEGGGDEASG